MLLVHLGCCSAQAGVMSESGPGSPDKTLGRTLNPPWGFLYLQNRSTRSHLPALQWGPHGKHPPAVSLCCVNWDTKSFSKSAFLSLHVKLSPGHVENHNCRSIFFLILEKQKKKKERKPACVFNALKALLVSWYSFFDIRFFTQLHRQADNCCVNLVHPAYFKHFLIPLKTLKIIFNILKIIFFFSSKNK